MASQQYSLSNQVTVEELAIFEPDENGNAPAREEWVNIASFMQEVDLYEGIMSPSMGGQILLADPFNLPDQFPIEPGVRLYIRFKTTSYEKPVEQLLVVYKIGERIFSQQEEKAQMYWLYLCSEEKYLDVQTDVSYGFKGTYSDLIKKSLDKDLGSKKTQDLSQTMGIINFVAPNWSPLTVCDFAANRAVDESNSPFFFWENVDKINFKSLKQIYSQPVFKRLFIEPRGTDQNTNNSEKLIHTIRSWEYKESLNLLAVHNEMAFGAKVSTLDTKTWNIDTVDVDQPALNDVTLEENPFVVIWSNPKKVDLQYKRSDGSNVAVTKKRSIMSRLKQYQIIAETPGDSDLRSGCIIEADVPSFSSGVDYVNEQYSSGKWLVLGVRHIIVRDRYRQNIEIIKDSTAKMII